MPHREKIAWLQLLLMAVTYGPYFTHVAMAPPAPGVLPNLPQLWLLAAAAGGNAVLQGVGRLWLRTRWPEDAREPADERDRAIERRSTTIAYYVLIAGMILVGMVMPFISGGWSIVNAGLLMIVVAESVCCGLVVWSYRRSAG